MNNPDYILYQHNFMKFNIEKGLNIVKDYIISNNLIIVGGMSIDLSLRTVNKHIYEDYEIPDYDVITNNHVLHSKQLGKILCDAQLPNIGIINAIHIQTMRIKMSGYTLFDCTYIPENVITIFPTIKYLEFTILHPHIQKIDQYNSLSFLFDITGPNYNIFHRLKKDIERNNLLIDNFKFDNVKIINKLDELEKIKIPINLLQSKLNNSFFNIYHNNSDFHETENNSKSISSFLNNLNDNIILNDESYFETDYNICCHGFLSYAFYYNSISKMVNESNNKNIIDLFKQCNVSKIEINNDNVELYIPKNGDITLINSNNNIENLIKSNSKSIKYNKLIDLKPNIIKIDRYELYDLCGKLLSVNISNLTKHNFIISNYNNLLAYFLTNYYFNTSKINNDIFLSYYVSLLNLIEIDTLLNSKIFNYSISTFGKININESYVYYLINLKHLYKTNTNTDLKPKKKYPNYPDCNTEINFDYALSEFFNYNGLENNDLKYTNYSEVLDIIK